MSELCLNHEYIAESYIQRFRKTDCPYCKIERLEKQLQQAHREGWEQGKRECVNIANNLFKYESGYYHYREDVGDAIAAMEYKDSDLCK